MTWHSIEGHDDVVEKFRRALQRRRLASSFLFAGPDGVGKRTFASKLAQTMLCEVRPEAEMDPCEECPGCIQVKAESHPDLILVSKPPDKTLLPLELLIGDPEHRNRRGLCHDIALKPFAGRRKIAIIDDADFLNPEGANSLLKTLEEPAPGSLLILIGTSPAKQLPTIRSRCQLIRFGPLSETMVAELLVRQRLVDDSSAAKRLAAHSSGSLGDAMEMAGSELWDLRGRLLERLADPVPDSVRLAKAVLTFVDEAGSEPSARRQALRQAIAAGADFYRHLLRGLVGHPPSGESELRRAVDRAMSTWPGDEILAAECLERCLEAARQFERNAHQANLVECWLDDLANIIITGRTEVRVSIRE
jgi:DNA polymerase-3 subunit delta'